MAVVGETLAYILGKNIVTQSLVSESASKVICRQAKLVSLALSSDGRKLAAGDDFGKIYVLYNFMAPVSSDDHSQAKMVIQSLPQWHSHSVNSLQFTQDDAFLLSAGKESVLVQWHLEKQDKSFVSRLGGGEIMSVSLSAQDFYSCIFSDNTFKVYRFENNKTVVSQGNLRVDSNSLLCQFAPETNAGDTMAIVNDSTIQFKQVVNQEGPVVTSQLNTNPRNFVSNPNDATNPQF